MTISESRALEAELGACNAGAAQWRGGLVKRCLGMVTAKALADERAPMAMAMRASSDAQRAIDHGFAMMLRRYRKEFSL